MSVENDFDPLTRPTGTVDCGYITKDSGQRETHSSGAVRDVRTGKGRYDLITPLALKRLAGVYERGAIKYGDHNWTKGMPISRYLDSAIRHIFNYLEGLRDEDHLAHGCWNLMAAMHEEEAINRGLHPKEFNDVPSYMPKVDKNGTG